MKKKYYIFALVFIVILGLLEFVVKQNIPIIESVTVEKFNVTEEKEGNKISGYHVEKKEEFTISEEEKLKRIRKYLNKINWESKRNIVDMAYHQGVTLTVEYENGETQVFDIWGGYRLEIKSNNRYGKLKEKYGTELMEIIY